MSLALPFRRGGAVLVLLILAVGFTGAFAVTSSAPAHALCVSSPLAGSWRNINPNTRSITRVTVTQGCGDQVLCDTDGHCSTSGGGYGVRVWGKCHPTDCDWGSRSAVSRGNGWILATYRRSYATSYVWLKVYKRGGTNQLRVNVRTDFTAADGRTDYTTDEWFRH